MLRSGGIATALLAVLSLWQTTSLHAQEWPSRPVKIVVAFAPGGSADQFGRLMAAELSSAFKQQFVIENRPGNSGTIGSAQVARAEPDGYTLLLGSAATLAIGPALFKNIGYDPIKSFTPVAFMSSVPYVMVAGPKAPASTVKDVIVYAKANPGKLNLGVPNGAPPHMLAAWFRDATATDIVVVPYKGAATVITDLIGSQIDLGFETTSVTLSHLHEGTIRPLGVAAPQRLPALPAVPTMIESGVKDFVASSWTGVLAPAGTPPEIVARLNAAINAGLNSVDMQARFRQLNAETKPGTPQDFADFIAAESPKWTAMAQLSGAKAE